VCVCVYMCACVHMYLCVCTFSRATRVSIDAFALSASCSSVIYMCAYIYIYIPAHICLCIYACIYVYAYIYTYVCTYIFSRATHVSIDACVLSASCSSEIYVCIYIHAYMCVCLYIHACVCVNTHICIYVCEYMFSRPTRISIDVFALCESCSSVIYCIYRAHIRPGE